MTGNRWLETSVISGCDNEGQHIEGIKGHMRSDHFVDGKEFKFMYFKDITYFTMTIS